MTEALLETLDSLARRAAQAEGLQVAWIELKRQGGSNVFRVFIEREDGSASLADCERLTHRLGLLLDVEDPIDSAYVLEVSTPGLDRPLRNEKDYDAGIFGRITGTRCRAHAPLSADLEGDVSHVAASQIPHRDDGDLATGFRANFKRDPVDPVDDRLIENAGSVYDGFSRRGAVSPRRSRNLDLLIGSEKKGKEKGQFSSRTGDGDRK